MKPLFFAISFLIASNQLFADIAPNPIVVQGIYTLDECKIQMTSEYVFADLFNDSAKVECTFNLLNFGGETEIQVGFPEMNFHYWSIGDYGQNDKANFKIYVDGQLLSESDIKVPTEMDSIYKKYMSIHYYNQEFNRKRDSIYTANGVKVYKNRTVYPPGVYETTEKAIEDLYAWRRTKPKLGSELWSEFQEQKQKGNFPWYVWKVHFGEQEKKQIKVVYTLPSGLGYGSNYRYFKYILETGSGWYKSIERADIKLRIHDIKIENLEEISPNNFSIDSTQKIIQWTFTDLDPTDKDNIYVQYFNVKERRISEQDYKKRERATKYRFLKPRNWFK